MEYIDEFKKYEKEKDKSNGTIAAYVSNIKSFYEFYSKSISAIENDDIEKYKNFLIGLNLKPKTINTKLLSLRNYINFINECESINFNIFVKIKIDKVQSQNYLDEMMSMSDFDRLVRLAEREEDHRAVSIFYTLYLTGMRVSELVQVKITDIEKESFNTRGKGEKNREVFPPQRLNKILEPYLKERGNIKSTFLFNSKYDINKPISRQTVHSLIKKYAGLAKVKLSKAHAHNFRHLYCLMLVSKGLKIEEIADLAGHQNINTTRIYTRKTKRELLNIIDEL